MSEKEKNQSQNDGERTGRQDLFSAMSLGSIAGGYGFSDLLTQGSSSTGIGFWAPPTVKALLGSGTVDGTNPYSPPAYAMTLPGVMLPGYGNPWPGTYSVYRAMSAHPTLALAIVATISPILGCEWTIEADKKKAPAEARDFIGDLFLPMRQRILNECLRSLEFGCKQFEQVLGIVDGYMSLVRLKPLLPDFTLILLDEHGNFDGLSQAGVTLEAANAFVCTYGREGDNWYGRSRHEDCRRAWSNWLADSDNLYRLGTKAASIIPHIGYPPSPQVQDGTGKTVTAYEQAMTIAAGMTAGRAVAYPNLANLEIDDIRSRPEMAKSSLWNIGTIDMGDSGPAQLALINQLRYWDVQMVRAWRKPERSLLQADTAGSRADSQSHGDISDADCDMIHAGIVEQINQQVVDNLLAINFGESSRGTVRIAPVPLVNEQRLTDQKLLNAILENPQALPELIDHLDMDAWLDRTGLPRNALHGPWDGLMTPAPVPQIIGHFPSPHPGEGELTPPGEPKDAGDPTEPQEKQS